MARLLRGILAGGAAVAGAAADHKLDHIDAMIQRAEGVSIAQKSARFFGLLQRP
jgi:hypothetical protein